jgi:F0F1-type ATP synthase assembly protein I
VVRSRDSKDNPSRKIGEYLGLAMLLPISTFVGYGMGYGLDKLFGTHFLYIIFMVLGTASGIISLIRELS